MQISPLLPAMPLILPALITSKQKEIIFREDIFSPITLSRLHVNFFSPFFPPKFLG